MNERGSPPLRRILHIIETGGPGGAETVLADLVDGLAMERWQSLVVLPRHGWLHDRLVESGTETIVVPPGGSCDIRLLVRLRRELRSFAPHLIHAHLLGAGVYGTLASVATCGPPLVCTLHGVPDVRSSDPLLWVKSRILGRSVNRVVYVSHDLRRRLEPLLGVPHRLGRVIHNGVRFFETVPEEAQHATASLLPSGRLVGAVGNVRAAKDYPNLLRAARLVCDQWPDVHFAVVGQTKGPLWEDLVSLRRALDLEGRVHFLGFVSRPSSIVQTFDLFVSSSYTEGLPLAPIEAMGMGKPVVLTQCGGVPEVVDHDDTGLLVPPGNPEALAAGILDLLGNPARATQLGSRAKESVRKRFSLGRMVSDYQALYDELLLGGEGTHA